MRYRRAKVSGGTYFFTVNLADRHQGLLVHHVETLHAVVKTVNRRHPFHMDAYVILPDHLHAIWTLPEGDADFATRWMLIKAGFSRHIAKGESRNTSRIGKGGRGIWQRRYWEHMIRDERDYKQHVDYIHYNPVKHAHVNYAAEWPHSSIHHYIAMGILGSDWGGNVSESDEYNFGER